MSLRGDGLLHRKAIFISSGNQTGFRLKSKGTGNPQPCPKQTKQGTDSSGVALHH